MATSVVFDLIDVLIPLTRDALDGVTVFDGDGLDDSGDDFLMIGWDDPDSDRGTSAEGRQTWAGLGARSRDEEGTITCLAISRVGQTDPTAQAAARAAVKATTVAVEDMLRADPNLGGVVAGLQWTGYGTRTELRQWLSDVGAVAQVTFEIAFRARL